MPLATRIREAFMAVWKKQQLALSNLTGNAFLLFVLYTWVSLQDLTTEEWLHSAITLVVVGSFGLWLFAATLKAFHSDDIETPFVPVLRRVPQFLPWALAMVFAVFLCAWLASLLHFIVWVVGIAAVLALLPMVSQAAGGGFSRATAIRIVMNDQYWLAATILLVVGVYIPFLLLSWVPAGSDFIMRALTSGVRFGFSYVLFTMSWLTLVAIVGRMGLEFEKAAPAVAQAEQRPTAVSH